MRRFFILLATFLYELGRGEQPETWPTDIFNKQQYSYYALITGSLNKLNNENLYKIYIPYRRTLRFFIFNFKMYTKMCSKNKIHKCKKGATKSNGPFEMGCTLYITFTQDKTELTIRYIREGYKVWYLCLFNIIKHTTRYVLSYKLYSNIY